MVEAQERGSASGVRVGHREGAAQRPHRLFDERAPQQRRVAALERNLGERVGDSDPVRCSLFEHGQAKELPSDRGLESVEGKSASDDDGGQGVEGRCGERVEFGAEDLLESRGEGERVAQLPAVGPLFERARLGGAPHELPQMEGVAVGCRH